MQSIEAPTSDFTHRIRNLVDVEFLATVRVLILGCGAVGSLVAEWLVRTGVTHLSLADNEQIEPHNVATGSHEAQDTGRPKLEALSDKIVRINPSVEFLAVGGDINEASDRQLLTVAARQDLVVVTADDPDIHVRMNRLLYSRVPTVWAAVVEHGDGGEIVFAIPGSGCRCWECLNTRERIEAGRSHDYAVLGIDMLDVAIVTVRVCLGLILRDRKGGELFDVVDPDRNLFVTAARRRHWLSDFAHGVVSSVVTVDTSDLEAPCPICRPDRR